MQNREPRWFENCWAQQILVDKILQVVKEIQHDLHCPILPWHPSHHRSNSASTFANRVIVTTDSFTFFFQALLQKRSMSVIITWLSNLFHSMEPWRRKTLSYFVTQPGIGLFWSCPLPITGGTSPAGRPMIEDPSVLHSCFMRYSYFILA